MSFVSRRPSPITKSRSIPEVAFLSVGLVALLAAGACSTTTIVTPAQDDAGTETTEDAATPDLPRKDAAAADAAAPRDAAPDASKACQVTGGDVYASGDICSISKEFTCGADVYTISCGCRLDTCSCIKNGTKYDEISASSSTCTSTCPGFHFERDMKPELAACGIGP
jgi:hypothetical protein